mmetsp:Transcript_37762/g.111782  ORF Transcript_37762/g.111782 Transcript_37762/m.111782 type:complete len:231 (+) Transcript_37762:724-1416(+)
MPNWVPTLAMRCSSCGPSSPTASARSTRSWLRSLIHSGRRGGSWTPIGSAAHVRALWPGVTRSATVWAHTSSTCRRRAKRKCTSAQTFQGIAGARPPVAHGHWHRCLALPTWRCWLRPWRDSCRPTWRRRTLVCPPMERQSPSGREQPPRRRARPCCWPMCSSACGRCRRYCSCCRRRCACQRRAARRLRFRSRASSTGRGGRRRRSRSVWNGVWTPGTRLRQRRSAHQQ